jgi:uncharacterized protein YhaN
MAWSLSQRNMLSQRSISPNDQAELRAQLDELDEQIGSQHDRIATLMHERNARPEDKEVAARLQDAFESLHILQHGRAELMSIYLRMVRPMFSEEDSEVMRRAQEIFEKYQNT